MLHITLHYITLHHILYAHLILKLCVLQTECICMFVMTNKRGNVRINVKLRRVRVTIVAVEKQ